MYRLTTKIGLTILCLSGFELYSRWVPLSFALLSTSSWLPFIRIGRNSDCFLVKEIASSLYFTTTSDVVVLNKLLIIS